ncbi:MAG: metal-dependent transcriptional regulator [Bdellovibrionaceae bacterium]|nr:metal-dependent transcriptional regulator [Pseudobdellovibrionaceae bacterium]
MSTIQTPITHSTAHYLCAIHKLHEDNGYVRMVDISKLLNFSRGSVSIAIKNLKKKNLVEEDKNGFLNLSKVSHEKVHEILANKTLLYYFLKNFLGVTKNTAELDSCLMEHVLSAESQKKLFLYMKKMQTAEKENGNKSCVKTNLDFLNTCSNFKQFKESQKGDTFI